MSRPPARAARAAALRRARSARGAAAHRAGHAAEAWAAAWLMLHGWRVLGFRLKTPGAEIDVLARRGGVLAAVEVKRRATLEQALAAVRPGQAERLRRAAADLAARRADLAHLAVRVDLLAMAPGRWPRRIAGL